MVLACGIIFSCKNSLGFYHQTDFLLIVMLQSLDFLTILPNPGHQNFIHRDTENERKKNRLPIKQRQNPTQTNRDTKTQATRRHLRKP